MRLESQRVLVLPGSPDEVWRLLSEPSRLPVLVPEIEDAWNSRTGGIRVLARLGRRRRTWKVRPAHDEGARRLVYESETAAVSFRVEATVEPAPEGALVRVAMKLEPPAIWKASAQPGVPRRVVQRLIVSFLLFALSAAGVVLLPSLQLGRSLSAVAYAVVGLAFLVAAALLSSAHGPRRNRRRLLPRLPALNARGPRDSG